MSSEILKLLTKIIQYVLSQIVCNMHLLLLGISIGKNVLIGLERVCSFVATNIIAAWPMAEKSKLCQCS